MPLSVACMSGVNRFQPSANTSTGIDLMSRAILSRLSLPLVAAVSIASGCDQRETESAASAPPELLQSTAGDRPDTQAIVGRQQALLDALVNPPEGIQTYITMDFTFIDHADTAAVRPRDLRGNPVMGQDYFRALAGRLRPAHAVVAHTELFWERPENVIVITTHETVAATVTAWERVNGDWMAKRMQINTPPERTAQIRAHFAAGAPRTAS